VSLFDTHRCYIALRSVKRVIKQKEKEMALPINIKELITGKTVETERIEFGKAGTRKERSRLSRLSLMILTIGAAVIL
jgi:hypothetical protein